MGNEEKFALTLWPFGLLTHILFGFMNGKKLWDDWNLKINSSLLPYIIIFYANTDILPSALSSMLPDKRNHCHLVSHAHISISALSICDVRIVSLFLLIRKLSLGEKK